MQRPAYPSPGPGPCPSPSKSLPFVFFFFLTTQSEDGWELSSRGSFISFRNTRRNKKTRHRIKDFLYFRLALAPGRAEFLDLSNEYMIKHLYCTYLQVCIEVGAGRDEGCNSEIRKLS